MLYMTVKLITVVLIYKIVTLCGFTASASTLIMPLWFIMGDVIAEVYGYKIAKKLIWTAIFCQFIFAFFCTSLSTMQSPVGWVHQDAYDQVFHSLPRVAFASFIAILFGASINAYAISKWKVLLKGKYFWLRSLGASAVGELVFTAIAYFTEFYGVATMPNILHLMAVSYLLKLVINPILIVPSAMLAALLKRSEGVTTEDDNSIKFNPFSVGLSEGAVKKLNSYKNKAAFAE